MNDQYKLVRIKRKWVPEWLFAFLSVPFDFISPKWLPFRYLLTEPFNADLEALRSDCLKALQCLYIAVDESVADDVNAKVEAYLHALERLLGI